MYIYCQQFVNKITASMCISCVVGNMAELYDAAYYYGKIIVVVRFLMMTILKLSANCWEDATKLSYSERIKLSTNEDSVAAIPIATHA